MPLYVIFVLSIMSCVVLLTLHQLLLDMAKASVPMNGPTTIQPAQVIIKEELDSQNCSDIVIPAPMAPTSESEPGAKSIERNPARKQPTRASKRNIGYVRTF